MNICFARKCHAAFKKLDNKDKEMEKNAAEHKTLLDRKDE